MLFWNDTTTAIAMISMNSRHFPICLMFSCATAMTTSEDL